MHAKILFINYIWKNAEILARSRLRFCESELYLQHALHIADSKISRYKSAVSVAAPASEDLLFRNV